MNTPGQSEKIILQKFPNFCPLKFEHNNEYSLVIDQFAPYGDYSFANLIIWLNLANDLEIAKLGKGIVIKYSNIFEPNRPIRLTFLSPTINRNDIRDLKCYMQKNDYETLLYNEPHEMIEQLLNLGLSPQEDRDAFDYILSVNELVNLAGTKFGKFRRKINKYMGVDGVETIIRQEDLSNNINLSKIINALHTWDMVYDIGNNDTERLEALAIEKTFRYAQELDFKCISVNVRDRVEAFTLFRINNKKSIANINHTKTSYKYRHLFDFTVYATASYLKTLGIEYINFEQDLGISGLREHKLSYRPVKFLKKYNCQI